MIEEAPAIKENRKFQFSLSLLLGAMLYAAALATVSVNLVGKAWNPWQIGAAYFVTIGCVVGFAVLSKARGKVAAYVLLSPLVFVASVVAAAMFHSHRPEEAQSASVMLSVTAPTTSGTPSSTPKTPPPVYVPPPQASPGADGKLGN